LTGFSSKLIFGEFLQYVGESERAVRQVFSRARASAPCVIFFDELDALVPRRDDNLVGVNPSFVYYKSIESLAQSESSARVVNTLLTELDGLDARKAVYVIAATNRPDMIDPAMVRPGRLDKLLYVDLPSSSERIEILRTIVRKVPLGGDTDGEKRRAREDIEALVGEKCDGYSGADLAALVREAGVTALKRTLGALDEMDDGAEYFNVVVELADFLKALDKVRPSVGAAQRKKYQNLQSKFAGLPVGTIAKAEDKDIGGKTAT